MNVIMYKISSEFQVLFPNDFFLNTHAKEEPAVQLLGHWWVVTDGRFLSTTVEDTGGNEEGSVKSNKAELLGGWSCEFDIPKDPVVRPGDTWVLRDTCESGILGMNGMW